MVVVNWLSKPRLNYIDCFCFGLAGYQASVGNWWAFAAIVWVGIVASTIIERRISRWRVT